MSVMTKLRAGGVAAGIAAATVFAVVPANADVIVPAVEVIQGALATGSLDAAEAGVVSGPAAPVLEVGALLGALAAVTAPVWVPWVQSTVANLFDSSKTSQPAPRIAPPSKPSDPPSPPMATSLREAQPAPAFDAGAGVSDSAGSMHFPITGDGSWPRSDAFVLSTQYNAVFVFVHGHAQCVDSNGVTSVVDKDPVQYTVNVKTSTGANGGATNGTLALSCASGLSLVSAWVSGTLTPPSGQSPANAALSFAPKWIKSFTNTTTDKTKQVVTATQSCIRPDGTTFNLTQESPATGNGFTVPSCDASSPGSHSYATTVSAPHPPGLYNPAADPNVWQTRPPSNSQYPGCDITTGASPCLLTVKIDGVECTSGAANCVQWTKLLATAPSRIECDWGPYVVPLGDCDVLERAFEPTGVPSSVPNTDGDPSTWDGTQPAPDPGQSPSASPTAGAGTGTDPSPSSSASPTAGGGTVIDYGPGGGADPNPVPDPSPTPGSGQCYPTGWAAFNPVEWVMKPVECALSWAFVPDTKTVTDMTDGVKNDFNRVGFGPIDTALTTAIGGIGGSGGCMGPELDFDMMGIHQVTHPLAACSGGMATAAGICNAFFTIVFIGGGCLALLRALGGAFGYNFSIGPRGQES